ncbi:MAG: M4 family metallopeptidase, partial [Chitinophagales bacterium]
MKKLYIIGICLCVMMHQKLNAQPASLLLNQDKKIAEYIYPNSSPEWIEFRKEAPYSAAKLFNQEPSILQMQPNDELRLWKTSMDKANNMHYKFAQYYMGVRVEVIEYSTHERNGRLHLANGNFVAGIQMDVTPAISEQQAIINALAEYPAEKYLWQNARQEDAFKRKKKNENATLYPDPELLLVKKDTKGEMSPDNYMLAYRMYIFAEKPHIAKAVYVDAITGKVFREKSMELFCNTTTIETTYNGTQTVYTDYRTEDCDYTGDSETAYFPIDDCNPGSEIRSYYSAPYTAWNYGDDWLICSDDNTWLDAYSPLMVMSSLWAVRKAFQYFIDEFGHESFDGSSGLIDVFNGKTYFTEDDDEPYCTNANFTNFLDNIYFGAGSDCLSGTTDDYNTLDIAAHEFTHGVIEYAHFDALDYSEESGALNESFADIFGEIVELHVEGGAPTWLHGEDKSSGYGRSFSNPNARND